MCYGWSIGGQSSANLRPSIFLPLEIYICTLEDETCMDLLLAKRIDQSCYNYLMGLRRFKGLRDVLGIKRLTVNRFVIKGEREMRV